MLFITSFIFSCKDFHSEKYLHSVFIFYFCCVFLIQKMSNTHSLNKDNFLKKIRER